ncbi:hypothetical protein [Thalassobellus citreus]|uniref:hypothetical protein n=1 Tax=Thalassobellus citreus TaxID=3367752 RepID=UPI00379486B4
MIKFQTNTWEWDVSNLQLTFNETSDLFSDKISKSFSFPAKVKLTPKVAVKLGLVNYSVIKSYKKKIYGYLTIDRNFYDAYISINDVVGDVAEIVFYYGKEVLPVFDKKLNLLQFGVMVASSGLPVFAKAQISKSWPEATHNFPKIFREEIKQRSGYEGFEYFVNNYVNNSSWEFPVNSIDNVEGVPTTVNRNVMQPCPYLLEILKTIFKTEGLEIRGEVVSHPLIKKIVMVPKLFFEKYSVSQFEDYSFDMYTRQQTISGKTINVYEHIHTPLSVGSYSIKFRINMSNATASFFQLKITQNDVVLYEASSVNKQVSINETLDINIVNTSVFDDIKVELKLYEQYNSIANFNNFTYEFKEGRKNVFPDAYTIADFMPDMVCREFVNRVKTWLNLKFDYTHTSVYISFLDNALENLIYQDKRHLEQPEPKRGLIENNLFKLSYPDKQEVLFSAEGQIYDSTDFVDQETQKIEMKVLPLEVTDNYNSVTAVYPKDEQDLMFCLYDGLVGNEPLAAQKVNNISLSLQDIASNFWVKWLKFRANSETYKDTFKKHISEPYNIKEGLFKYSKKHIIKSIRTKRINDEHVQVDVESETF